VHRVPAIGVWWAARPPGAAFRDVNPFRMSGRPKPGSKCGMMTKRKIAYGVRVSTRGGPMPTESSSWSAGGKAAYMAKGVR
jgi:hypothetical protein